MVLVHANPFDNTLWTYQAAHFSTWFKVISVDIRGYGRSIKQTTPFTLKDMCDDVVGVMRDAGVERAVLMGCSVGSSIALLLGLDHPELFDAVILVGGNSEPSDRFQHRIDGYVKDLGTYHCSTCICSWSVDFRSRASAPICSIATSSGSPGSMARPSARCSERRTPCERRSPA